MKKERKKEREKEELVYCSTCGIVPKKKYCGEWGLKSVFCPQPGAGLIG